MKPEYMDAIMRKYGFKEWDAVLAALGHGGLKEGQIINKMLEFYERDHRRNMTNDEVLAAVAESSLHKNFGGRVKKGIIVKELMMLQSVFLNAVLRYREMKLLVLLPEDVGFPFIEQIVLMLSVCRK